MFFIFTILILTTNEMWKLIDFDNHMNMFAEFIHIYKLRIAYIAIEITLLSFKTANGS